MKPQTGVDDWAFSYLRFSSPAQKDGDSTRRQAALRDAWLKAHPTVTLDTTLHLADEGVSGFRGAHRTDPRHALAEFDRLVSTGRVPVGSYLIVENLDRLTRENPIDSIPFVLGLIRRGIRVVQLTPSEQVYDREMDERALMGMLLELSRGHGESRRKSGLVSSVWEEKRRRAREEGTPMTAKAPAWLRVGPEGFELIPSAAAAIRMIFDLCIAGSGDGGILRELERAGIPPITGRRWGRSYIGALLRNRSILGHFQPRRGNRGQGGPDGPELVSYFPPVVSEEVWFAAQRARADRTGKTGRPSAAGGSAAIWSGLLYSAVDGERLYAREKAAGYRLVSAGRVDCRDGADVQTFPLDHFTAALLSQLSEVAAADLFNDQGAGQLAELRARLGVCEGRLGVAIARFEANPSSPTWADKVDEYDREKRALVAQIQAEQQRVANPVSLAWQEALELMVRDEPQRLRQVLLRCVQGIWCVFSRSGETRFAGVQVWFREGGGRRDYLLLSHKPTGRGAKTRRPRWLASSLTSATAGPLDLRDRAQAVQLSAALSRLDPATFLAG